MHPLKRLEAQLVSAVSQTKPKVPEAGRLLWQWFGDLHETRTYGMSGPNPISYMEMDAWCRIYGVRPTPENVRILRAMDAAWLKWARQEQERAAAAPAGKAVPHVSSQELSLKAFDVMFS